VSSSRSQKGSSRENRICFTRTLPKIHGQPNGLDPDAARSVPSSMSPAHRLQISGRFSGTSPRQPLRVRCHSAASSTHTLRHASEGRTFHRAPRPTARHPLRRRGTALAVARCAKRRFEASRQASGKSHVDADGWTDGFAAIWSCFLRFSLAS